MFNGESKKRPTVSLRGKSKEEDRTEFLRRARAQRQGRARERLHVSSATTIQRIWRGRSCVGKWRERERREWDRKMHDVGRVQAMLAAKGKTFQVPAGVLQTLLSQLVNFHVFPRDTERFRSALELVLAAAGDTTADPRATGIFAPLIAAAVSSTESRDDVMGDKKRPTTSDIWRLLVARLGTLCLFYMAQTAGGTVMVDAATDAMEDDEGRDQAGEKARVETGSGADTGAADSAARVFGLLSSPRDWRRRGLGELQELEAETLCQDFLTSLAIGRVHLSSPRRKVARGDDSIGAVGRGGVEGGKGKGVRLMVRLDRREADGRYTHTPRLFRVLRVLWDAAAGRGETAVAEAKNEASPLRLLCVASLKALGIDITSEARETSPAEGRTALDRTLMSPERKVLLEAFAASILPAPRLLDHPCRALLVDAMFAGEARAWWELVSVAGDAVGEKGACVGETGSARRRDVAWAVANVLKVDTGMVGAGAEQPHALVQALCRLLRKVSLHALLQGAGRLTAPGGRGVEGAGGMQLDDGPQLEEEDDDDIDMDDIMSDAVGRGGTGSLSSATGGGAASVTSDDFAGESVRLEAIVRFHRRRCGLRIDESPVETLPAVSSRGKRRDLAGPGMERAAISAATRAEEVSGELEAMAAAAERLANPAVVGKLFDSILPPVDSLVGSVEEEQQQQQHHKQRFDASKPPSDHVRGDDKYEGRPLDDDGDKCGDDPVLALCTLYADMVLDGVHAGPGVAAGADLGAAAAASGSTDKPSSGAGRTTPGKSVLNALAFGRPRAPIAARLWAYLRRRRDLKAYVEGSRAVWSGGGVGGRGGMHSALFLFCSACSHQLLALDDEEFYEKQRPLTLVEVRQLVGFLKKWLCRLYWLDPAIPRLLDDSLPSNPATAARLCEDRLREALLLLSATRLFNQLYERNTRRSFLEAEQWYWKAISAKELSPPDRGGSLFEFFRRGNLGMVLTNIPQVIPFFQRVSIFRQMIDAERNEHQNTSAFIQSSARIRVSRETLYEDSAEQLTKLGSGLKGRIQVTFLNQHGVEEAGIDGGGVFKEYMDLLTKRAFDPQYALFMATEDQYLFPNPAAPVVAEDYLFHFEFLGRVLGKAVFEDILVEPQFSPVFLNKLLGRHNYIDDLYSLDPVLYRNLMQLKAIVQKGGDAEDLSLTFSATTTAFGDAKVWDLIPQGRDVPVTNASVISYIHLMAHFKLNVQTARPCKAFLQGFRDLIPVEWIRLFNPHELQRLIGGEEGRAIDIADLKRNTRYAGGYHKSQPVMQWFWDAIVSFTPEEQGRFLKFVTSCSRPPLLGFERLNPPICVQKVPSGRNGRLPSSSTCMNLLKLPEYEDRQTLRDKLLYAISSNAGFELT